VNVPKVKIKMKKCATATMTFLAIMMV